MIKLIVGNKGSGKTKALIEKVNEAVQVSKGNVVCIEKGSVMTFNINYNARLIDIDHYDICGYDAFYGFLAGILAGNYDITDLFVDATLRIGGRNYEEFGEMIAKLKKISKDVTVTFTVSCDKSDLPEDIQELID